MIRKYLWLLLVILIGGACQAYDFSDFRCSPNPYQNNFSYSNLIGTNFISEKIANVILKKQILKESKGKYKVNLQSYNITELKKGIFKSLEIKGTGTSTNGIYASEVKFKTICDYNYIETNNVGNTTVFKEPFGMTYLISFTEDDLNNTMSGKQYAAIIRRANNIGNSYKLFNIVGSSAKIEDNKLYYTLNVKVPFLNAKQELTIETDVKAKGGEIILSDTKLVSESFKLDLSKFGKILNYLNPLDYSMQIFEDKGANVYVQEVSIKNNVINVAGILTIDKDIEIN